MPTILIMPVPTVATREDDTLNIQTRDVPEGSPLLVPCPVCHAAVGMDCRNVLTSEPRGSCHAARGGVDAAEQCGARTPSRYWGDTDTCVRRPHNAITPHVFVFEDMSAFEWFYGDESARGYDSGMFTPDGERTDRYTGPSNGPMSLACPDCSAPVGNMCVAYDGTPRRSAHISRSMDAMSCTYCHESGHERGECPEREECENCGERGHQYIDCPVGDDEDEDDGPYDESYEESGCSCVDCVAAASWSPDIA